MAKPKTDKKPKKPAPKSRAASESMDANILGLIKSSGDSGASFDTFRDRTTLTPAQIRGSLARLKQANKIHMTGVLRGARYHAAK